MAALGIAIACASGAALFLAVRERGWFELDLMSVRRHVFGCVCLLGLALVWWRGELTQADLLAESSYRQDREIVYLAYASATYLVLSVLRSAVAWLFRPLWTPPQEDEG